MSNADATTVTYNWTADLVNEVVFVKTVNKHGEPMSFPTKKFWVEITKGTLTIIFKVGKGKDGYPVFTDTRAAATGHAVANRKQYQTPEYCKSGKICKLTATGWAAEVERLIGPAQIGEIFAGLVKSGFTPA